MRRLQPRLVWGGIAFLLIIGATLFLLPRPFDTPILGKPADPGRSTPRVSSATNVRSAPVPDFSASKMKQTPAAQIEAMLQSLAQGGVPPGALDEFREVLLGGNPRAVIAAMQAFLATGRDARTGEDFLLGEEGALTGAPTLRVLLLDLLGRVARTAASDAAAITSRALLEGRTSADEWAVALRNVGWQEPQAMPYLGAKARELLSWPAWRAEPSAGFLEAFDVAVFTGEVEFVPMLNELRQSGSTPLQRAATVALDRLSEASPLAMLGYLNAHPQELGDRPFLRADYYAKADLGEEAQRRALEVYLVRTDVAAEEKEKVLESLPAPASIVTEALLSAPSLRPDDPANLARVRSTYTTWLNENRFPALRPVLQRILASLE